MNLHYLCTHESFQSHTFIDNQYYRMDTDFYSRSPYSSISSFQTDFYKIQIAVSQNTKRTVHH